MCPLYHSLHDVPPRENKCLWFIYIYLLLANLSCYSANQLMSSTGYMTFRPIHFQPIQFQPLPFQPLTILTYYIFNRSQFRPKLILANGS